MIGSDDSRVTNPRHPQYKLPPDKEGYFVEKSDSHKPEPTLKMDFTKLPPRRPLTGFEGPPEPEPNFLDLVADGVVKGLAKRGFHVK